MSSSTQVPTRIPHVDPRSIYGAFLIGCILTALLFGVTNVQAFIYIRRHAGRWTKFYKFIVLLLWTLDALQLALTVHCVYYYLVTNFANAGALVEAVWSFKLQAVFTILTVYIIHLLYSHRIWIGNRYHNMEGFFMKQWSIFMGFSVATFLDVLITCSLWYLLASSRTGIINICALASIIICSASPLIFLSAQFLVAKLYINSYIALLNTGYYLGRSVPDVNDSSEIRREPRRDSSSTGIGSYNVMSHEKFPPLRKSMLPLPGIEVVPPTRPLGAVNSRKSILVTVEKESFVDL
ncbi:hypothetical protein BDR04DRAFT_1077477 [Suillus decipiens]|nr:hypothetical protein BDR04DRAFT_1077477 [Suillus decipiens]